MKFGTLFLNRLRHLVCVTRTFAIWNRKEASRYLQSLLLGRNIWFGTLHISAKGLSFGSEDMTPLCTARLKNQCMLCRCISFVICEECFIRSILSAMISNECSSFSTLSQFFRKLRNQSVCFFLMMTERYHWWEID